MLYPHTLLPHRGLSVNFLYSSAIASKDHSFLLTTYRDCFLCNRKKRFVQLVALFSLMRERDKLNENFWTVW